MYQMILILLLIVGSFGEDTHPACLDGCFYDSPESCPGPNEPRCTISPTCSKAVVCCNLTNDNLMEALQNISTESKDHYRALHIMQSTFDSFNISVNIWLRFLRSFALTESDVRRFDTVFPKKSNRLHCLNLTSNGMAEMRNDSVRSILKLNMLDLSGNKLKMLPDFASNQNVTLDISNNSFECETLRSTMKNKTQRNLYFINQNRTWCAQQDDTTWYKEPVYLGLTQIERINEIESECPQNCTCKVHRVDVSPGSKLQSSISFAINCAEQQLTSLPSPLPDSTISLNVSMNNISSLDKIKNDTSYKDLRELYAFHNNISSIIQLESTRFISNFVALDLRHNNIKSVPTYMFMNTFDRNNNVRMVRLGQNRLACNCETATTLKLWLAMAKQIEDSDEIYCENGKQVLSLDTTEVCQEESRDGKNVWKDYLCYIITAEVILLVILVAKVSYDYWVFKTKGYLPWPANKMPKLPCDWLCE